MTILTWTDPEDAPHPLWYLLWFVLAVPAGMSRAFMCGQGGISGDLAEIFRGEGNIKMMTGWVG